MSILSRLNMQFLVVLRFCCLLLAVRSVCLEVDLSVFYIAVLSFYLFCDGIIRMFFLFRNLDRAFTNLLSQSYLFISKVLQYAAVVQLLCFKYFMLHMLPYIHEYIHRLNSTSRDPQI